MKTVITIPLLVLFATIITAQETRYIGSLIKINFYDNFIDTTQTIGNWESISKSNYYLEQYFEGVFTYNNNCYLIKNTSSQPFGYSMPPSFQKTLINTQSKVEKSFCSSWYPECGTGTYLSTKVNIYAIKDGFVFTINYPQVSYIFSSDSLFSLNSSNNAPRIFHVVGKVENKYLIVANNRENYKYEYYLENLSRQEFPSFDRAISFKNIPSVFDIAPNKSAQLLDSLYLMQFEWNNYLYLMRFSENCFSPIDSIELNQKIWFFKNDKLFYNDGQYLVTRDFDKVLLKFQEKKNLLKLGLKPCFDYAENYFATIDSDTLKIFSLKSETLINKLYLKNISKFGSMLIDSPYVYIHKTEKITGVNNQLSIPDRCRLYQNYPNPFSAGGGSAYGGNPATVISYQLSVNSYVTLKVYDVLGREVATLINEYQQAGNHKSTFNILHSALAAGVYFYTLRAGGYVETKKMILMR